MTLRRSAAASLGGLAVAGLLVGLALVPNPASSVDPALEPAPSGALVPGDGLAVPEGDVAAGRSPDTNLAPQPPALAPPAEVPFAQIQALLDRRSDAVREGDAVAFLNSVARQDPALIRQQRILARNLVQLPLDRWQYAIDGVAGEDGERGQALRRQWGPSAWILDVDLSYRLDGYDVRTTQGRHVMAFVQELGEWKVAADIDTGAFLEPWDVVPLRIVRGERTLVLSAADAFPDRQLVAQADDAVDAVTRFWGTDWAQRVVIVVPTTQAQLGQFLRRPSDRYSELAAVATAELSNDVSFAASNRVWVNPGTWSRIDPLGRSIVLRHEIAHVATGAAEPSEFPIWLEEGFADYVGYRGSGVPTRVIARDLFADAARGRVPNRFPNRDDFEGSGARLGNAYEGSWWATQLIVDRYGEQALLEVYRTALEAPEASSAADRALRQVLGISEADLLDLWRASLVARGG